MKIKELVENLKSNNVHCCVYELYFNDNLLYVGSSKDLLKRIKSHILAKKDIFNRVEFTSCKPSEMTELEARKIFTLNPAMNVSMPQNNQYTLTSSAARDLAQFTSGLVLGSEFAFSGIGKDGAVKRYIDIDEVDDLKKDIRLLISRRLGCSNQINSIIGTISAERKLNGKSSEYAGTVDGRTVTDYKYNESKAIGMAFMVAGSLDPNSFSEIREKDHLLALAMNECGFYDYKGNGCE